MTNIVYLVTGAAGFLGSNVCAQLLDRGERVRADHFELSVGLRMRHKSVR